MNLSIIKIVHTLPIVHRQDEDQYNQGRRALKGMRNYRPMSKKSKKTKDDEQPKSRRRKWRKMIDKRAHGSKTNGEKKIQCTVRNKSRTGQSVIGRDVFATVKKHERKKYVFEATDVFGTVRKNGKELKVSSAGDFPGSVRVKDNGKECPCSSRCLSDVCIDGSRIYEEGLSSNTGGAVLTKDCTQW